MRWKNRRRIKASGVMSGVYIMSSMFIRGGGAALTSKREGILQED